MNPTVVLRNRWQRASRRVRIVCLIMLILMTGRLFLPYVIRSYVNRQLNLSHDYGGRIGTVELQLWRGRYQIYSVEIVKRSGAVPEPLFAAPKVDLAVEWRELLHGAVVGEVVMHAPRLNFVAGPTAEQTQTGQGERWDQMLASLFPFKLNRFEISNGQIHFQNHHSTPPVDVFLTDVLATATNLSNSRNLKEELPAGVMARGRTLGGGGLVLRLRLNPMEAAPTFQVTSQLTNVDLTALNDFLKAYGKFDVERGRFALFTSVAAKDGSYEGYLKLFFENLDVFAWEKERKKNILEIFWQAIVGTLTTAFKNQSQDRLATRVPISGSYGDSKVGIWTAVTTLLRNAFIRALVPKIDETVTLQEVEEKQKADRERNEIQRSADGLKGSSKLIKTE